MFQIDFRTATVSRCDFIGRTVHGIEAVVSRNGIEVFVSRPSVKRFGPRQEAQAFIDSQKGG